MVKDCWMTLGIAPTDDLDAIKRAYRELVKKYHPDTVITPEQKRKYTILCAQINDAYRNATEQAKVFTRSQPQSSAAQSYTHYSPVNHAQPVALSEVEQMIQYITRLFKRRFTLATWLLIFLGLQLIPLLSMEPVRGVVEKMGFVPGLVAVSSVLIVALMILFIFGIIVAGALDLFVALLFPRRLIRRMGLGEYENKIVWLSILIANITLFFFTDVISTPGGRDTVSAVYDGLFRALAAGTLPMLMALNWLRDFMRYRRVKNRVSEFAESS